MNKVVVITGANSGIGLCTAQEFLKKDCIVYDLSRRENSIQEIKHITTDITDINDVKNAISKIIKEQGKIDILINNAGFGISGAIEFTEIEEAKKMLEVNFFGMINTTKEVIPYMRKNEQGRIINISSVAAEIEIPFQTYYSVSKAAINSFTKCLQNELKPFNINTCAIMPGDIKTGFTKAREKLHTGDDTYNGRISSSVKKMEQDEENGMDPKKAGEFISKISLKKRIKVLYTIGFKYKIIIILSKILSTNFINRLIYLLYAR